MFFWAKLVRAKEADGRKKSAGEKTNHDECSDEHGRRDGIYGGDLGDEVAGHADDGDEGDKLHGPHDAKGHAESAEPWWSLHFV